MIDHNAVPFSLRQIRYFLATAETLSITEAAHRLHISQPSVSTTISALEEMFGTQLFIRHHAQGMSLTPAGRLLASEVRALLKQSEELNATLKEFSNTGSTGALEVGFLVTLAPMLMPTLTKGFTDRFPNVRVTPTEGNHAFLLDSLRTGLLDCVVTYDFNILPELNFHSIIELPPFVLLPPEHRLAKNASVTLAELADEPMVQLDLPLSREYFNSLFVRAGLQPRVAYRSAFADVVHAMVAAGFGYALWNFPLRNMMTASGSRFISRPLEPGLLPARLGLVSLESNHPRKVVRTFHDHCVATLTDGIPDLVAIN